MFEEPLYPHQPSFSKGEVSPDLYGRADLQAYSSALRTSRNAFIKTEGSWSNRPGTQYLGNAVNVTAKGSVLIPFVFSTTQSYVLEIGVGTAQIFSDGALITTLAVPWLLSELPFLRYTQSADTLTVVHPNHVPRQITRTSASVFSIAFFAYTNGPFIPQNTDGTTLVSASGITGTVTLTASSAIFNANHVGALFYLEQQDITPITPWTPETLFETPTNPVGVLTYSNLKNYKCVAVNLAGGATSFSTGTVAPDHTYGTQWDGIGQGLTGLAGDVGVAWQFQDFGYGVVKITGFTDSMHVTAVVQPVIPGQPALLPATVVGPRAVAEGPFTFTGDGVTTTFGPLTAASSTDPNRFFVTLAGVYDQPPNYTITGTTIVFLSPPGNGVAISVSQVNGLYATSFWAFGAFSPDQGYPSTVSYFPDRLIFAGTPSQPVGVFGSQTSQYTNFAISNPVVNSDAFTIFLNARQLNSICDLIPLQDLIVGTANIIWRLWPGINGTALGPLSIDATPQAFVGETSSCAAVLYGDSVIYAIYGGRRIRDLIYQFQFDKYVGAELTAYSRHLVPFGTYIVKMVYAPDPWGQLFALRNDGALLTCTYVRDQQMIAWSRWDTQGTFEDICIVPENNSYALYLLANRTIQGKSARYVERLNQWEWATIYDYKFSDCSLTYDGRNTSQALMVLTGGTTWQAGDTGTLTATSTAGWTNFQASDVTLGNAIQLFNGAQTVEARVLIIGYTSPTVVSVRFIDPIPPDLQAQGLITWTFARTYFTGATQLAGQMVAVLADSNAISGTNGVPVLQVANDGSFTLPNPCGVVTIGLQYFSDLETLALNQPGIETVRERTKGMPGVFLDVHATRGLLTGTDFVNMSGIKERAFETYLQPTNLQEGIITNRIDTDFSTECHICVRQPYPLPVTIRMVIPSVNVGVPAG